MIGKFTSLSQDLAYLDPGSGSFLLQIILASILGALFVAKSYWNKLRGLFHKPSQDEEPPKED